MTNRVTAGSLALALALVGVACGGSEKAIVDRYFGALNSGDNQTLSSFAAVSLEQEVQAWTIDGTSEERSEPAVLPDLAARHNELVAKMEENKKEANAYALDRLDEVDLVRELLNEDKPIPARLQEIAEKWREFNELDRDLKAQVAEARVAMEEELRIVRLSVGNVDGVENIPGNTLTKTVDLTLTVDGLTKPYEMTLRRYDLEQEGPRPVSRWVVFDLQPKG